MKDLGVGIRFQPSLLDLMSINVFHGGVGWGLFCLERESWDSCCWQFCGCGVKAHPPVGFKTSFHIPHLSDGWSPLGIRDTSCQTDLGARLFQMGSLAGAARM